MIVAPMTPRKAAWRKANIVRIRALQAAWRRKKRATDPAYRTREAAKIVACNRIKRRTPAGRIQNLLYVARKRAKAKGLPFSITLADLGVPPVKCPVLGITIAYGAGKSRAPDRASVDRFDNNKGYVPGNVRVISYRANSLKNNATLDEVRAILRYMEGK